MRMMMTWMRGWVVLLGVVLLAGCIGVDNSRLTRPAGDKSAFPATRPAAGGSGGAVRSEAPVGEMKWVDAWGASFLSTRVNGTLREVPTFNGQTLRVVVFSKLGGSQVRVKVTNKFEETPLVIGAAHVALRGEGGAIVAGTDRALTFGGAKGVTVPAGEEVWSDGVELTVPQHADVAVSVYLPGERKPGAFHATGLKTSYISGVGDFTGAVSMAGSSASGEPRASAAELRTTGGTTEMVFFVSGLQVMAPAKTVVIACLGDSITDGSQSTVNTNTAWPDGLSKRLPALKDGTPVSVINMGIGSNRIVTSDGAGPAGVHRLEVDVLERPNVTYLILLEGINDISYEHPTPEQLIGAYKDVIARAHGKGIKVIGGTLLPIGNSYKDTPENEATRVAVNRWIREGGGFDAVVDFEKAVADPGNPKRIKAELTKDYVHPNSAGYTLMAEVIDLRLFE